MKKDDVIEVTVFACVVSLLIYLLVKLHPDTKTKTKHIITNIKHHKISDTLRDQHIKGTLSTETFKRNIKTLNDQSDTTTEFCNGIEMYDD